MKSLLLPNAVAILAGVLAHRFGHSHPIIVAVCLVFFFSLRTAGRKRELAYIEELERSVFLYRARIEASEKVCRNLASANCLKCGRQWNCEDDS